MPARKHPRPAPSRYRGYYYDTDTGFYYLQSRYYDPAVGRFLNADSLVATGQGILGNNMFAYCLSNPVAFEDPFGTMADWGGNPTNKIEQTMMLIGGGAGAAIAVGISAELSGITDVIQEGISDVIEMLQDSIQIEYQYWEAYRDKKGVHLGRGLTFGEATLRVALGLDIMCASQDAARWLLVVNRYWFAVGPEIHGDEGYYRHYHPNRHTHTHIWFYG